MVLSYASMGASAIMNLLNRSNILMVAEGLDVFQVAVPHNLVHRTLAGANISGQTGCTVVALHVDGNTEINPDPHRPLPADGKLTLIGSVEDENRFLARFGNHPSEA
jgi:voltage-gated potassium channel